MLREAQRLLAEKDHAVPDQSVVEILPVLDAERLGQVNVLDHGADQWLVGPNSKILVTLLCLGSILF